MNSKLDRFITIAFLIGVILAPLSIALNLCGNVLFDDKQYVSFIKWDDIAVDSGLFILSAFYLCAKLFGNPSSDAKQDDTGKNFRK
jgi:hypothetical protein